MIDFHSHIIPNIDDGSRSVEETAQLLEEASRVGFDAIISTSHYIEDGFEANVAIRQTWIDAISKILEERKINLKIYLGSEVYITDNIIQLLDENVIPTINGSDYVLFEYPLNAKPMDMYKAVYDMQGKGYKPILAHPERYKFIQEDPDIIYDLIQKGVLMQSNYASIIGYYGEEAEVLVKKLLENNMVHFFGSDVHRERSIYPLLKEIKKEIEFVVGRNKLKELSTTNPSLVLENKPIDVDEPIRIKLTVKERKILKS